MHNCSQDDVENFFSHIRSGGGNRDNPSAFEFATEYRKVTVDSLFDKVRGSNCNLDAGEFLVKLNQLQDQQPATPDEPDITLPGFSPVIFHNSDLVDNTITLLTEDICQYVISNFCCDCCKLVCDSASSVFSRNEILSMDMSKNNMNRIQPTILFNNYIKQLYILFNLYVEKIVHKANICNTFLYILSINNVIFKYCDVCVIHRKVIVYFIKRRLKSSLSVENLDTVEILKGGNRKSRKILKLQHL